MRVIADPASSAREVSAASRALLAAESQNQSDEHKVIDLNVSPRNVELDALAADLGVEIGVIEHAAREAEGSTDTAEGNGQSASKN